MSIQAKSYPVDTGVTVRSGDAVVVVAGKLQLADETSVAVGFAVDPGTAGDYVTVRYAGEIYAFADGAIPVGVRVQASDDGNGTIRNGAALGGRMLGIALSAAVGGLVHVAVGPFDATLDT
jgi:hypothetical protein